MVERAFSFLLFYSCTMPANLHVVQILHYALNTGFALFESGFSRTERPPLMYVLYSLL